MYQRFQVVITFLNVSNLFTSKLTFHNLKARCVIPHSAASKTNKSILNIRQLVQEVLKMKEMHVL